VTRLVFGSSLLALLFAGFVLVALCCAVLASLCSKGPSGGPCAEHAKERDDWFGAAVFFSFAATLCTIPYLVAEFYS
jgi:hypothetical protein